MVADIEHPLPLLKTSVSAPDKVDGLIGVYDGTRYLVLFSPEKNDGIYNRIRYLISQKIGNIYVISHCYTKIKFDSYDFLPLKKY